MGGGRTRGREGGWVGGFGWRVGGEGGENASRHKQREKCCRIAGRSPTHPPDDPRFGAETMLTRGRVGWGGGGDDGGSKTRRK